MVITTLILGLIFAFLLGFAFYAIWRFNKYVQKLEQTIDEDVVKRLDGFEDKLNTAIKEEYLKTSGELIPTRISKRN